MFLGELKMVKLQEIIRKNESKVYSVNIPLEIIDALGWKKGKELNIDFNRDKQVIIKEENGN